MDYPVKAPEGQRGLYTSVHQKQLRSDQTVDLFKDVHSSVITDGITLLIHNPFEALSDYSILIQAMTNQTISLFVTPEITEIEDSLVDFEPEE